MFSTAEAQQLEQENEQLIEQLNSLHSQVDQVDTVIVDEVDTVIVDHVNIVDYVNIVGHVDIVHRVDTVIVHHTVIVDHVKGTVGVPIKKKL